MPANVKKIKSKSKFDRPPALDAGTYPARVVQIIYLGVQEQRAFKGEPKPPKEELRVTYELLDEFMLDEEGNEIEDKPRWVSENFTLNSLDSDLAKSTKRYYALDPEVEKEGDFFALAGSPCLVTLSRDVSKKDPDTVYNNVKGVQAMRSKDAKKAPDLVNDIVVFDVDEPNLDVFLSLPEWLQGKIKENLDFGGSELEAMLEGSSKKTESEPKKSDKSDDEDDDGDW